MEHWIFFSLSQRFSWPSMHVTKISQIIFLDFVFCNSYPYISSFVLIFYSIHLVTSYVSLCKCISTVCTLTSGLFVARHSRPYNEISLIVILQKCPLNRIVNPQLYKIPLACLPYFHPMLILLAISNLNTVLCYNAPGYRNSSHWGIKLFHAFTKASIDQVKCLYK